MEFFHFISCDLVALQQLSRFSEDIGFLEGTPAIEAKLLFPQSFKFIMD
jgi:hypothetical protein